MPFKVSFSAQATLRHERTPSTLRRATRTREEAAATSQAGTKKWSLKGAQRRFCHNKIDIERPQFWSSNQFIGQIIVTNAIKLI